MKKVIAIIDIGKTNKKLFLFNEELEIVFNTSRKFEEIKDEDGFPCDDIEAIERWVKNQIEVIQNQGVYRIKAINFSTHGASLVYLNKEGKRIAPLYNYLKPLELKEFEGFYAQNDGVDEFCRKTASPSYGMLNTGIQMLWIKRHKPHIWKQVESILHYPQYLSYLFTKKITADFTSVGAHTATWDFDDMQYHSWLKDENIKLPNPSNGNEAILTSLNGEKIAIGSGLHDSSSSIVPILKTNKEQDFVLLSTGTWIITMNPFSTETLTRHQLINNCLCFMTPEKQQVKSSMLFLGKIHEVYLIPLSLHFKVNEEIYTSLVLNEYLCKSVIKENKRVYLAKGVDSDFEAHETLIHQFDNYEKAYYQLVYEIAKKVVLSIDLVSDKNKEISRIFISGGFAKNIVFVKFLSLLRKNTEFKISESKNESALGAAMLMKKHL